jgi:hypothetical protein
MHYKVPAITSYVNEDAAAFCLGRINGDAHRVVVEAAAGGRIELPAVPRAAEDALPGQGVPAGIPGDARTDRAETERAAVMRAAVANGAKLAVHADDPDLTALDPGDDVAVALELGDRADVLPAHARARPSRSP